MQLGNEFTHLACDTCHIKPLEAKMVLYHVLDDAYARYFKDVFDEEDRQSPRFTQWLGSFTDPSKGRKCTNLAHSFIQSKGLRVSEWKRNWQTVALGGRTADHLSTYGSGALGNALINLLGFTPNHTECLVAKRVLLDLIACPGADEKVFTEEDRSSYLYGLLDLESWRPEVFCSPEFLDKAYDAASELVACRLDRPSISAPYAGVTFGWKAQVNNEWHLYGDLVHAELFRCRQKYLPYMFGTATTHVPAKQLQEFYDTTYLCIAAVDTKQRLLPNTSWRALTYSAPVADLVACTWVGTLSSVLGPYKRVKNEIAKGRNRTKKEEGENENGIS